MKKRVCKCGYDGFVIEDVFFQYEPGEVSKLKAFIDGGSRRMYRRKCGKCGNLQYGSEWTFVNASEKEVAMFKG